MRNPQRARNRSHATWVWYIVAAFFLLALCAGVTGALSGCTARGPNPIEHPEPTGSVATPTNPLAGDSPTPNAVTRKLCDDVTKAYMNDKITDPATRDNLIFQATRVIGVNGRVADAVANVLYAGGSMPAGLDDLEHRYRTVLSRCRATGWR